MRILLTEIRKCQFFAAVVAAGLIVTVGHADPPFSFLDNGRFQHPPILEGAERGTCPAAWLHFAYPEEDTELFGLTTRHARAGDQSLFLNVPRGSNSFHGVFQRMPARPGTRYAFRVYARNDPDAPMPDHAYGQLSLEWRDARDDEIGEREWGPVWTRDDLRDDEWTPFLVSGTAPEGAVACFALITYFNKGAQEEEGGFLVDDAAFQPYGPGMDARADNLPDRTETGAPTIRAHNRSLPTRCAEHDNVNIPIRGRATSFTIEATHPGYSVERWDCETDFTGCPTPTGRHPFHPAVFNLYDDTTFVFEAVRESRWRLPRGMMAYAENHPMVTDVHFIRLYRQAGEGEAEWPQFLILYMDGNIRLVPFPPAGQQNVCFGSSVIIGPAPVSDYPIAEIHSVRFLADPPALRVVYHDGSTALIHIEEINRELSRVRVDIGYDVDQHPFTTFRSMYVDEGNCDADRVGWLDHEGIYHGGIPIMDFRHGKGGEWYFHRAFPSRHNQSAPDIRITIPETSPGVQP